MPMPPSPVSPAVLVRKYGGSSLASVDRISIVARDICAQRAAGHAVVVVVSAMGQTTDELAQLAHQANRQPPRRELDMLLSVGERITMSLLSMALAAEGCSAISFTGSQCGIITDNSHTDARIIEVKGDRVRRALADGFVVVVAGFQGVSLEKEITTLGRGGSDATAVALAAALGARRCEILKDVPGVMTADPKQVPAARRLEALSFDQLRDLATSGCGVVHLRAVEYAAAHDVPIFVGSSFADGPGTVIEPGGAGRPASPASDRYRPLALIVHEDVAFCSLTCADPDAAHLWRDRLLANLPAEPLLAEWFDRNQGFHWEAVAPAASLRELPVGLGDLSAEPACSLVWRDDYGLITLAGGQPASWLVAETAVADLLRARGLRDWRLRADGPALRLLVPANSLASLPDALHAAFFPA